MEHLKNFITGLTLILAFFTGWILAVDGITFLYKHPEYLGVPSALAFIYYLGYSFRHRHDHPNQ